MKRWEDLPRSRGAVSYKRSLVHISLLLVLLMARTSNAAGNDSGFFFERDKNSRLTLLWYDGYRLASHSFRAMSREVESIFSEIGVEVCWHDGSHGLWRRNEPPNSIEIRLVLLPVDSADWGYEGQVMGAAVKNLETSAQTHTVYVFFPNVLRTLGLDSDAVRSPRKWRQIGRALGRVLAHEIVHAIASGHPHRDEGLMGRQLRRSILLKRELRLDPVTAKALRTKLQT